MDDSDTGPRTVAEAGEAAVLAVLRGEGTALPPRSAADDPVGNGDDAAVLGPAAATVVTTDMLVEGTHFRLELTSWFEVGRRAVAQNVSDVLAMGADCTRIVVAVALPGRTPMSAVGSLAEGIHTEAMRSGAHVVGGDLTAAESVVVCVTALGTLPDGARPVRIDGARPGDRIALTGAPGRSAAGLALLLAGYPEGPLQDVYRVPETPVGSGTAARKAGATALTDVSDGLLRDLSGIARASGVSADLVVGALPVDPWLPHAATLLGDAGSGAAPDGPDPRSDTVVLDWMLDGGEDHGLLAAFPPEADLPPGFVVIGEFREGEPGEVTVDGEPRTPGGWDSARGA